MIPTPDRVFRTPRHWNVWFAVPQGDRRVLRLTMVRRSNDEPETPQLQLTPDDIRTIRARAAAGETRTEIARDYSVGPRAVGHIINRQRWAQIK